MMWPFECEDPIKAHEEQRKRVLRNTDHLIPDTPGENELIRRFMIEGIGDFGRDVAKLLMAQSLEIEQLKKRIKRLEDASS